MIIVSTPRSEGTRFSPLATPKRCSQFPLRVLVTVSDARCGDRALSANEFSARVAYIRTRYRSRPAGTPFTFPSLLGQGANLSMAAVAL